jgi:biopolymer transport protein ExbD
MKRKRRIPQVHAIHPNVTPLIDIVMCLVIFFMLVARIGVTTGAQAMVLPASIQGVDIHDMGNTLTLNVWPGPNDQPIVRTFIKDHEEELKITDKDGQKPLAEVLAYFRYGPDRRKNSDDDNPNFSVIIRAEQETPYRYIEPVLTACAEAGVRTVNFNTRKVEVRQ